MMNNVETNAENAEKYGLPRENPQGTPGDEVKGVYIYIYIYICIYIYMYMKRLMSL